jgi:hypothetical protein
MAKTEKCAHDNCVCTVPENGDFGKYCSAHCQDSKDVTTLRCECGHAGCIADAARRPLSEQGRA